jgi:hypothetical protein
MNARRSAERLSHAGALEEAGKAEVGDLEDRDADRVASLNFDRRGGLQKQVLQ